jgi:hypothetical protein
MKNPTPDQKPPSAHPISDEHLGAVEGNLAADTPQGNRNAPALDDQGMPTNKVAIAEDVLGANNDGTEG